MVKQPVRIVPLHPAAPTAGPRLTYRGGPLLSAVEVFTVFWGTAWQGAQASLMQQLNDFFTFVVGSPLLDQLAEYSVPAYQIGQGTFAGTTVVTAAEPQGTVTDADIQAAIQGWIQDGTLPAQTPNSLTFVFLPPGVTVDLGGGELSCAQFCGYHESIGGTTFYAVMPHPDCQGCLGGLEVLTALTSTSSHELCEAITDPVPGQGWYDDTNGEIGDICAWQTKDLQGWTVQLEWSNQAGSCV